LAASSEPAFEVGGDLYGYHLLRDNSLAITIGDVSGKGMPAALMMATTIGLLGAHVHLMEHPAELLSQLNGAIRFHAEQSGLNTALCALRLVTDDGYRGVAVEVANAGAVWPILRRATGQVEWLEVGGPPLGTGLSGFPYLSLTRSLLRDDLLILSSDGIIEAHNQRHQLFGFERFETAVALLDPSQSASTLHANLLKEVRIFTNGVEPHDDLTLMVLKVIKD